MHWIGHYCFTHETRLRGYLVFGLTASFCLWLARGSTSSAQRAGEVRGSQDLDSNAALTNLLDSEGYFIQIPGPNPAIVRGGKGTWDEGVLESAVVFKDFGTYYWYFHATPLDKNRWSRNGYRIGVATSQNPLGPWTKYEGNPVLDLGPEGAWDDAGIACAFVLKEGVNKYDLWYCGIGSREPFRQWTVGLATSPNPLGPWKKYPGNPIIKDFGYVSGVVNHEGKYFLYSEYPIGSTAQDYGPISLATADQPEGPWKIWEGNPVLKAGDWGAWDDGGTSGGDVTFVDGVFHMFYGAAKQYRPRMLTRESIGYAYSFDGYHFIKYARNPVARREAEPNAASFSEVYSLFEPPLIYLFHTLRYVSYSSPQFPRVEDLGIQVLATRRPFRFTLPVLRFDSLPAATTTALDASPPINLDNVSMVAVTVECSYQPGAQAELRIHARGSVDGMQYDTADFATMSVEILPGQTSIKTWGLDSKARYVKFLIENPDPHHAVSKVQLAVTLGGQ